MQAAPIVVPATPVTTQWPTILPGPFILLLMLPAIPLLLFSIGARPPDTHSLPFSTDDLWQTTAFITIAGAVVLCLGLYPGLLSDVSAWVQGDSAGDASRLWDYLTVRRPLNDAQPGDSVPVSQYNHQGNQQQLQFQQEGHVVGRPVHGGHRNPYAAHGNARPVRPGMRFRYEDIPKQPDKVEYRSEQYRQDQQGNIYHRPAAKRIIPGEGGGRRLVLEPTDSQTSLIDPTNSHTSISARHIEALRNSVLSPWYSPARPSLALGLLVGALIIGLVIVTCGKILHGAYDIDKEVSKKSSKGEDVEAWYIRELQKRKKETPEATAKRMKEQEAAFVGKLKKMDAERRDKEIGKRKKEIEMLKKELQKRKMPLVGLEWEFTGKKKGGVKDRVKGMVSSKTMETKQSVANNKQAKAKEPGRLKKMLLGPLASGPPKDTSLSVSKKAGTDLSPEGGPGWKPADDAVAHAAIRGGAARAENLANALVKQKVQ